MGGDEQAPAANNPIAAATGVEPQYRIAKTSVWWDIENCQVPKACDPHVIAQNISSALVKMNYCGPVTISAYGDTTAFPPPSNTPSPAPASLSTTFPPPTKASAALVAAAKCVWYWTSLVYGDFPFTSIEHSDGINASQQEMKQTSVCENILSNEPASANAVTLASQGQKFPGPGRIADSNLKLPSFPKAANCTNVTRMTSLPIKLEERKDMQFSRQPESIPAKQFMKAPHEFFGAATKAIALSRSAPNLIPSIINTPFSNSSNLNDNLHNQFIQPRPPYAPENLVPYNSQNNNFHPVPARSDGPTVSAALPDVGRLSMSDYPGFFQNDPVLIRQSGEDSRSKSIVSLKPSCSFLDDNGSDKCDSQMIFSENVDGMYLHSKLPISSSSSVPGVWGSQGCQPPPEYVQGLIGVILLALNTLKVEKIAPTEANITDCIRYGDPKHRYTDVRKALKCALDQQMIVKQHLGKMELYVGRVERLWICENPIGGNTEQYPKTTWAAIQKFLTSPGGRSAFIASECRYEAALILRNSCLKKPLGRGFSDLEYDNFHEEMDQAYTRGMATYCYNSFRNYTRY
ncbi:UNVERIFIED_CONTAM: hypothetical protein Sangu_2824100 [Sesamum angustifolium]|uniref:NYN domain-containing protein n=1 Tax=Sesamum angustifolium TaxID=2727405 RepID=A0AAW2IQX3_9LAMI